MDIVSTAKFVEIYNMTIENLYVAVAKILIQVHIEHLTRC